MGKKTIVICASISFYEDVVKVRESLVEAGFDVVAPPLSLLMQEAGDYEYDHYIDSYYKGDVAAVRPKI